MWCHDKVGRRIHGLGTLVAISRCAVFSQCWLLTWRVWGKRWWECRFSQLGWLTICRRISSPSSDFDVSQVPARFRFDGSMPRRFMIISRRRMQESRTSKDQGSHVMSQLHTVTPTSQAMRLCLCFHHHLERKKRECQEKCSTSYVSGRPKATPRVRSNLHQFLCLY